MFKSGEEILADLSTTLDQLITNSNVIDPLTLPVIDEEVLIAMQKTQESLLAHFLHTQGQIEEEDRKDLVVNYKSEMKNLQEKLKQFHELNTKLIHAMNSSFSSKKPRIGRNRKALKVR